jgi:SAM-dependent methyltransferase
MMNRFHLWFCQSDHWRRKTRNEILPWALDGIDLGEFVLEVGPGLGITTDWLRHRSKQIDALEVDPALADTLQRRFAGTNVNVRCGDATNMPYDNGRFSAVVSFTMLHHIPSPELQDHFFREAHRVLQSGGVFIGVDSLPSFLMRLVHLGDTLTLVSPDSLNQRLESAGFTEPDVELGSSRFRFSAKRSS